MTRRGNWGDRMTEQPDLNTGKEWSKRDLFSFATVAHIATFQMRTETEVREKAAELRIELK